VSIRESGAGGGWSAFNNGMTQDRGRIARGAAEALEGLTAGALPSVLVGFDGFIDSIVHMVDTRHDMSPGGYRRLRTIEAFSARCASAAGKSTNIEQVLLEDRFGGNGPLMAGGLARLGARTTYVGCVGDIGDPGRVHAVFRAFAARCEEVIPIGAPSTTDCLEFDDGKLMFNNTSNVQAATWARLMEVVGLDRLRAIVDRSSLIGIVNWSLLGGVPGIWEGLIERVLGEVSARERRVFIDLSDPAKRTDEDVRSALAMLRRLEEVGNVSVTLGLNLAEAERVARAAKIAAFAGEGGGTMGAVLTSAAERLREGLGLECVAIHPREGAAAANSRGERGWFDGPFTRTPRLSTGAGDHFNAGFAFGQVVGLSLQESLAVGCAVSGAYVRDAESPGRERLVEFLRAMPGPE
jgi:sugar/nucleoside kinase (ribokinase family)